MTTKSLDLMRYNFFNNDFEYSLYFQEYFKVVRYIDNNINHLEHDEYTSFFDAIRSIVPTNKIILDIGANSGLFGVPLSIYGYNVIGFEPVSSNIECLRKAIESNNINMKIYPYALSNVNEVRDIYVPGSPDNSSLIESVSTSNLMDKSYEIESVNCVRLDDFLNSEEIDMSMIGHVKIDVQGYELQVIEGMTELLSKSDDISLIIEWDMNHSGLESLVKITNILNNNSIREIQMPGSGFYGNKIFKKIK